LSSEKGLSRALAPLVVVVGSGGVGKTTLAAALALGSADAGLETLVMTFDPSLRLKDTLGIGEAARDTEVEVSGAPRLSASLLDARRTFDRLIERYAPDEEARRRILENRYYTHLAGGLAGILEYMAVERLFEVAKSERYARIVLDTPPTRQALDFLEAPDRIVSFLNSGVLKLALRPWFDASGRFRPPRGLGPLRRGIERLLDETVGLELLREMNEFFQAFAPLYGGFEARAGKVRELLRSPRTLFVLVAGPGEEKVPDALFFARKLEEAGHRLGPVIVNRVHPRGRGLRPGGGDFADPAGSFADPAGGFADPVDGRALIARLGELDWQGLESLGSLLGPGRAPVAVPLLASEPNDLASLRSLAQELERRL
jgi:anion-transporting  ArsA/GET3 family ATPase